MAKNFINCGAGGWMDSERSSSSGGGGGMSARIVEERIGVGWRGEAEERRGEDGSAEISLGGNSRRLFVFEKFVRTRQCATHREIDPPHCP